MHLRNKKSKTSKPTVDGDGDQTGIIIKLEEQLLKKTADIEELEEANMQEVIILKEENKKLSKKLKQLSSDPNSLALEPQGTSQKQLTQRQVAALSVEHDELSKKVEEMKLFLSQNEHQNSFIAEEQTPTYRAVADAMGEADKIDQLVEKNNDLEDKIK